jgi:hypothetical protein
MLMLNYDNYLGAKKKVVDELALFFDIKKYPLSEEFCLIKADKYIQNAGNYQLFKKEVLLDILYQMVIYYDKDSKFFKDFCKDTVEGICENKIQHFDDIQLLLDTKIEQERLMECLRTELRLFI